MRWTGAKVKVFFTAGIYWHFWHSYVCAWLRDMGIETPEQDWWRMLIPFYNLMVWWKFLAIVRQAEISTIGAANIKPLSVPRAFLWSSWAWFGAVPYVNRHLNAIAAANARSTQVVVNNSVAVA